MTDPNNGEQSVLEPTGGKHPADLLQKRYILVLGLIACVTILGQVAIQPTLYLHKNDAPVINIAGRQRMLSQKLTKTALAIDDILDHCSGGGPPPLFECGRLDEYLDDLRGTLRLWTRSQMGLRRGDTERGLPGDNSPEIAALFKKIEPHYRAMDEAAKSVLASFEESGPGDLDNAVIRPYVLTITGHERTFLAGMNDIVFRYEMEAQARVARLRNIELSLASGTLVLLLAAGLMLFAPAIRLIRAQFAQLGESRSRFRRAVLDAPFPIMIHAEDGEVLQINKTWTDLTGYGTDEIPTISDWAERACGERREVTKARFDRLYDINRRVREGEYEITTRGGEEITWDFSSAPLGKLPDGRRLVISMADDVTDRKRGEAALQQISWLLRDSPPGSPRAVSEEPFQQPYGDLTELNSCRVLADAITKDVVAEVVEDYLDLLETSAAVYETNGDYALGILSSGWCRFLDRASRNLCGTDDNREALVCGKWCCHESCWTDASEVAIATGLPADIECNGGIHIYAVPIRAGGGIVGAINFGYGDPPSEPGKLREIAERYAVNVDELRKLAESYESRPPFLIEIAKGRLHTSARLLGEMAERKRMEEALREAHDVLEVRVEERTADLLTANEEIRREVAERKRTEDVLRESEERYRALFDQAPDAIVLVDAESKAMVEFNDKACEALGYTREEFRGLTIADVEAIESVEEIEKHAEKIIKEKVGSFETKHRTKTGELRNVLVNISCVSLRGRHFFQGIWSDITKRTLAEEALRKREEQYRHLFDQAPLSIWEEDFSAVGRWIDELRAGGVEDLDRYLKAHPDAVAHAAELVRIVAVNQGTVELFDAESMEEFLQPSTPLVQAELGHGYSNDAFVQQLMAIWKGIGKIESEFRATTFKGNRVDCLLRWVAPRVDGQLDLPRVILAITDVTERKRAEEQLRIREAELAHASRLSTMGATVSGLAHELNQPLSAVSTYADACKRMVGAGSADELVETLDKVAGQAERASKIIHRVQRFVRNETPHKSTVDINGLIRETVGLVDTEAGLGEIAISLELSDSLPPVVADAIQIQQVIVNLVRNAFDAMKQNDTRERKLTIQSRVARDDEVTITVRDTGVGFEGKAAEHLFEPFFTTKSEGMGLGLSVSQSIVQAHGGRLWATPNSDRGVTFRLSLPIAQGARNAKR